MLSTTPSRALVLGEPTAPSAGRRVVVRPGAGTFSNDDRWVTPLSVIDRDGATETRMTVTSVETTLAVVADLVDDHGLPDVWLRDRSRVETTRGLGGLEAGLRRIAQRTATRLVVWDHTAQSSSQDDRTAYTTILE